MDDAEKQPSLDLWRPLLCGLLILAGLTAAGLLILNAGGCISAPATPEKAAGGIFSWLVNVVTASASGSGPNYVVISIMASLLFVVGVVALVASYWVPLIPRRAALICLGVSVGCWVLQYVLDAYLGIAVLVTIIAAIAAAIPWVIGYVRLSIQRAGERLALTDPRAGVAVQAVANPKILKVRKERLLKYEAMAGSRSHAPAAGSGAIP